MPEVLPARGGRAGCLPCGAVWKKHCEAAGKALKDFSRGLCHACFFRRWGHSRLTPESSRYTPKGLRRHRHVQIGGDPGPGQGGGHGQGDGAFQGGLVQIAAPGVADQGGGGGGQEEQQIDALSGPLVHIQKERHDQKQQRAAAHTPGRENAGPQAAEKGNDPVRHSRYFTPA